MSTRTNIVITHGDTRVYVYRHHDGYLAGTGADLVEKLKAAKGATAFLQALLDERYEKSAWHTEAPRVYELTSEIHGDIDYIYSVRFATHRHDDAPEIGYAARGSSADAPGLVEKFARMGSIETFVTAVNQEIREQNARLAQLRKEQPGAFGDSVDQPELAA